MKRTVFAGLLSLATAVLPETNGADMSSADMNQPQGCVIGEACRPLKDDVPVYVWLVGGKPDQVTGHPQGAPKPIRDASAGLATKTEA